MSSVSAVNSLLSGTSTSSSASSIDLSSLLQAATGASSAGIDVTSAVQAAVYAVQAPERQWQAQQTTITSQITALTSIQTALTTLTTDMNDFGDLGGSLASRTVTSSTSAVTATATAGAAVGQHTVAVQSLATNASWYSPALSSGSELGTGTVTITNASGTQTNFTTGGGVDSLSALASAINASSAGVNASVINDANGARLALVSSTSSAAADFSVSVTGGSALSFQRASTGANASLTVDGVPISSVSNTVTGAIPGITLNLSSTTTAGSPASLQVTADDDTITQAISSFVTDYNAALSQVNSQFTFSSATTSQGTLSGDSDIRSLQDTLLGITGYNISSSSSGSGSVSGSIGSLVDLGISVGDDGSLSLDTSKLTSALANPSAIQSFFQGSSLNGFAQSVSKQLSTYSDLSTGSIAGEISNLNQQYSALGTEVTDYENGYVASQRTLLTAMYSKAEIALQQLPSQMQQIQAELGNNTNSSGNG